MKAVKTKHNVRTKIPPRKSVRGFTTGRTLRTTKQPIVLKESNSLVGKFVLPTRSVHSSRVIKPNKRFINVELSDPRTFKKRVITKRHCVKTDEDKLKTNTKCAVKESDKSVCKTPIRDVQNVPSCPNGRVVLRQARLQLHTQTPSGPEGPFSSNSTSASSPPGTVTCGVCGAVRFYRFVKQARKFNIYSCESCRKFISKMIKRLSCGKNLAIPTLVCHKGQGMCHVPPIVRSQQWKLIRCAYRARCPACWLKMCLRSFQMPVTLKNSLAQLLPKNMQGPDLLFNTSLPLLSWQAGVEGKTTVPAEKPVESCDIQRSTRLKTSKIVEKPVVPAPNEIKRQKIDLKGPRVKHVCRSASIVLGQPLATFPVSSENKKDPQESAKPDAKPQESNSTENKNKDEQLPSTVVSTANITSENDVLRNSEQETSKENVGFKQPQPKSDTASLRKEKVYKNTPLSVYSSSLEVFCTVCLFP